MSQQIINVGNLPDNGDGDPLRTAFIKTNDNFTEIYTAGPVGSNIQIANNTISTSTINGNIILSPKGIGVVQLNTSIMPRIDNVSDLGAPAQRFNTLYLGTGGFNSVGNITGNYFIGNGSLLTGVIAGSSPNIVFGNSRVAIQDLNGNIVFDVHGKANVITVTTSNVNVDASLSVTNAVYFSDILTVTGNVTGGNLTTTGLANVSILQVTGNANITGNIVAIGNITAPWFNGNISGNIHGNYIVPGSDTQILFNDNGYANASAGLTFNKTTNALTTTGNVNSSALYVTGDGVIGGNLNVNGSVSYINVNNLNVQDPIIGIGRGANNAPLSTNDGKDRGEQLWYYAGSEKSSFVGYDNSAANLILATDVSITNEIVTVNNYGNVTIGNLSGQYLVASANVNAGNIISSGVANITGNVTGGNFNTAGIISATGNITGGNLTTAGTANIGILSATGTASVVGNITGGNVTTVGTANVGTLSVTGTAGVVGNITGGNVTTTGTANVGTLAVVGNQTVGGTANVTGNITGGNLTTAGTANIGALAVTGTANIVGNITGGNVTTAGTANIGTLAVTGSANVVGNITGGNLTTLGTANVGTLKVTGNVDITGNTNFTGNVSAGNILATSNVTGGNLTTTGIANIGTLVVTGTSSLVGNVLGNLNVTGNVASGNFITPGLVSATGNVNAGNVIAVGRFGWTGTGANSQITNTGTISLIPDTSYDPSSGIQIGGSGYVLGPNGSRNLTLNYNSENGLVGAYRLGIVGNQTEAITNYGTNASGTIGNATGYFGNAYVKNVWTEVVQAAGNITGANITTSGLVNATGNITSGNITTAGTANIGALIVTGSTTLQGNIAGNLSVTGNIASGNIATPGLISATGNVSGGNIDTTGLISATGNVTGGNLTTTGTANVGTLAVTGTSALTGNVTGNLNVTGNVASGNITTPGLLSATGNVSGGNITTAGIVSATGNVSGGNVITTGLVSATGNVTGGNVTTTGIANVGTLAVTGTSTFAGNVGGNLNVTGNIAGGNITTPGLITATGNITSSANIAGNFVASGSNREVMFNDNGLIKSNALLTFSKDGPTLSLNTAAGTIITGYVSSLGGTDLSLTPGTSIVVSWANINPRFSNTYALGTSSFQWKNVWAGNANVGTLGATSLTATSNIVGGNLTTTGIANVGTLAVTGTSTFAGNIDGNLNVTGNIASGNITTPGLFTALGNITGGNLITAGLASVTGNITGGNLTTTGTANIGTLAVTGESTVVGNANITGNISGNYITAQSNLAVLGNKITTGTTSGLLFEPGNVSLISGNIVVNGGYIYSQNGDTAIVLVNNGEIGSVGIHNNLQVGKDGQGNLDVSGYANLTSDVTIGGYAAVTGNVTGGNLNTAGQVVATANITGGNIITSGIVTATGNVNTAANVNAAYLVSANVYAPSGGITIAAAAGGDYNIILNPGGNGTVDLGDHRITNVGAPSAPDDAATKQYVDDSVSAGIHIHEPVKLETGAALTATYANGGTSVTVDSITGNKTLTFTTSPALSVDDMIVFSSSFNGLTAGIAYFVYSSNGSNQVTLSATITGVELTGLTNGGPGLAQAALVNSGIGATLTNAGANAAFTADSTATNVNDRILVYNQANAAFNGVYVVSTVGNVSARWVLTRASDADYYSPANTNGASTGDYFYVTGGSTGAGESYVLTAPTGAIIFGTSNIVYTQFSASQVYSGANGVSIAGSIISANVDNDTTAIVSGNIVVKAGANLTTPNIGAATGTSLILNGNITANNITANSYLAATTIDASANITGGNIISNGSASITGNTSAGNLVISNFANVSGNLHAFGNAHFGQDLSFVAAYANLQYGGTANSYVQIVAQNKDNGSAASTDFVATADNGTDNDTYIDMGINSSAYNQPGYELQGPNDGYLVVAGNTTTGGGNLVLGTLENNDIVFALGGMGTASEAARLQYGNGLSVSGNVYAPWFIGNVVGNISGNLAVAGPNRGVLFNDDGVANSVSTFTFNKATNAVSLTGNLTVDNVISNGTVAATGNVSGNYILGNGALLTGVITSVANINNGTSNVRIDASGGNILANVGGVANVLAITTDGANVVGNLTVTSNVSANYFLGNGYYLTGIITSVANINNGTSNIRIDTAGGNILANVGGVANVFAITTLGANVTGTLGVAGNITGDNLTATSNVTGGNIATTGLVSATGNVSGGNVTTTGLVSATGNVLGGNLTTTGLVAATGNIIGGNLTTTGIGNIDTLEVTTLANVKATTAATSTTTGSLKTAGGLGVVGNAYIGGNANVTGNVSGGNVVTTGLVSASGNVSGGNLTTTGVVSTNNIVGSLSNVTITTNGYSTVFDTTSTATFPGNITTTGNVQGNFILGNGYYLTGIITSVSNINSGTSNLRINGSGGNILANVGGVANVLAITTDGANVVGNLTVTSNVSAAYLLGNANASSLTSGTVPSARLTGTYAIDISGLAATANTVTDAAQPNITSVGTLSSLTVTGNVSGGNLTTTGIANVATLVATANANVGNLNTTGIVSATGNISGSNLNTTGVVAATGNLTGGNLNTTGVVAATGNVTGGNLTTTGNIDATGNIAGNFILGNGYYLTGIITSVSNINNGTSNVRIDAAGGNILANVGGTANVFVLSTNGANIAGNMYATGNVSGDYMFGNGYYLTGVQATASNISLGTSNVRIDASGGNVYANIGGTANVLTIASTGLYVTGVADVSGNVTGGNLTTTGTANVATLAVSGSAIVSGNLTVGGNTTYINVSSLNVQDPIIGIGRGANNDPLTSDDGKDRGEQLWYYSGSEKSAFIGYDDSSGNLFAAVDVSIASEVVTVNSYGNFVVGGLSATTVTTTGNVTGGNLTTAGNVSGAFYFGNAYYMNGIASLSSVYNQFQVQGNTAGNSLGNVTINASTTSGVLYPQAGNGITMVGNASTGVITFSVTGSVNDGTFWSTSDSAGLVSDSINEPDVDNGLVTDGSISASYDLGGFEYTANAPFNAVDSDLLPTTPNTYVVGNSALSWKSAYIEGNVTSASGYFIGNGALLSGVLTSGGNLSNGNSNIAIVSSGGNIALTVTANSNVAVFGTGVAQIKGNVVPAANAAYNLGSSSLQWNSLYVAGNTIYLGNISLKAGTSNTLAVYGSDGSTPATMVSTSGFAYNSSNITANTNVTATYNSMSTGPITINNNIVVTVDSGATWTVV